MQMGLSGAIPQALKVFVELKVADILALASTGRRKSLEEIVSRSEDALIGTNKDALSRTLRLLSTVGVVEESYLDNDFVYHLTEMGSLLQTDSDSSLAPMIKYFVDEPFWNAWGAVPKYISGQDNRLPFDAANGMSTQDYYRKPGHAESLKNANAFVRFMSQSEIQACVKGFDWSSLSNRTVVDLGGYSGHVMEAVAALYPDLKCICLDLPEVVVELERQPGSQVQLVGGDMFDPKTIPRCDAIFMKHIVLCEFEEEQSLQILRSCYKVLPPNGRVIIAESILPDHIGDEAAKDSSSSRLNLYIDYFMMLDGRGSSYTASQWKQFANRAGFDIESIATLTIPTSSIIVLRRR
jgi:caffeic acid 3-O-methyltransferase